MMDYNDLYTYNYSLLHKGNNWVYIFQLLHNFRPKVSKQWEFDCALTQSLEGLSRFNLCYKEEKKSIDANFFALLLQNK